MSTMVTKYLGDLECENKHIQANAIIKTGAPADNNGKGDLFSPTDLVASAAAQCALITIDIARKKKDVDIDITGATCKVEKKMGTSTPRRIAEITYEFTFPRAYTDEQKQFIEKIVHLCPVVNSLNPEIKTIFSFNYL